MMTRNFTKVLLVCANPRGTDYLRTAEEDRTLRESIQLSPNRETIQVETLNAATIDDLRRRLLASTFDIVHFSGHGTRSGLVFENSNGTLMVPNSSALAELLNERKVKSVVLNACYSLSVGKITSMGLDYTIASTGPISDPGAIEFTRGFYDALGAGRDVADAYKEGKLTAKLKGFQVDAILLRKGDEYIPVASREISNQHPSIEGKSSRILLGTAIDVSGSMKQSLSNRSGIHVSRFNSVQDSLVEIAAQVRDELITRGNDTGDAFQIFLYAFGLRVGVGVADMASLWEAAQQIDLEKEIAVRTEKFEAEASRAASGYGDLANLARGAGFGSIVDSFSEAARRSAKEQIIGEIGEIILSAARNIGDTTLSADQLANKFKNIRVASDEQLVDHVIYGATPMTLAAREIQKRFERTNRSQYDHRILLLVSDGEPTDGDPKDIFARIMQAGVDIITCFVTDVDVADPRTLVGKPLESWPVGARLMWDIASEANESTPAVRYLLSQGWSIEPNAKLFVQANHSEVLKEFMRISSSYFISNSSVLLPIGQ